MNKAKLIKLINRIYQNDALVEVINMTGIKSGRYALDHLALENQKLSEQIVNSLGGSINEANKSPLQQALTRKFGYAQQDDPKSWEWSNRSRPYFNSYELNGNKKPKN